MPRSRLGPIANMLTFGRWLQLPLYLGLMVAQTTIHVTFLLSAPAVAAVDRIMPQGRAHAAHAGPAERGDH